MLRKALLDGLKTGLALAATTTMAIMLFGKREKGSPWAAINVVTHLVDGDLRLFPRAFSPRDSTLGLALNGAAMVTWGLLYEGALALTGARSNLATAGLATAAIWTIDYHLLPPRLSPGLDRVLGLGSVIGTYAVMGATLAASRTWHTPPLRLAAPLDETREEAWFV
ncbi:MAG: hypothetical protein ABI175_28700 [Polyangiales bacterium]